MEIKRLDNGNGARTEISLNVPDDRGGSVFLKKLNLETRKINTKATKSDMLDNVVFGGIEHISEDANVMLKNGNNVYDSVKRFQAFGRQKRSVTNLEGLQRGLFAGLVNRTFKLRHEEVLEEIMPSLIILEDIVVREAQKTKLNAQRVNIKLRDLEMAVKKLSERLESTENATTQMLQDEGYSPTETPFTTAEVSGSGEGEYTGPDYITPGPPGVYNITQDYMAGFNLGLDPLYTIIEELEHKASKMEGFMSRSAVQQKNTLQRLNQLQDEMDHEQRKLRLIASESSYIRSRISVLDNELTSVDGFEVRLGSRITRMEDEAADLLDELDEQKDTLRDFKRTIYKQTQTVKDLEGADTVHERDTRSIQQNLARLQVMVTRIYESVDASVIDLRTEIKGDLGRLCLNNNLIC
ncbi:hypothetical protein SNE40_008045 [Patella caerulea]